MASHFLLSAKACTLSLATVLRLSNKDAETMFAGIRWPETNGKAVCPHCACPTCYEARRPNGALRFCCKACRKDFSLTSMSMTRLRRRLSSASISAAISWRLWRRPDRTGWLGSLSSIYIW
jgi:predicted nucleic acid-binding Zn ribbon protein